MRRFVLPLLLSAIPVAHALEVISAPVDHLFVPAGFDNNDNVEVVVSGHFPSSCYSRNKVDVNVVADRIEVKITAIDRRASAEKCIDVAVPFVEVVTVGNLQAGSYKIHVNESSKSRLTGKLSVAESRSHSMDDFVYSYVDHIELGFAGGTSGSAWLRAQLPSPCLEFDHVEYLSNGSDVISIMPIMKQVSDFCPMKMVPYEIPLRYDLSALPAKQVLLFSRSMDGKSVSTIVKKQ